MIGTKAESKHEWRLIKILIFIFIISSLSYSQTLKIYHLSKEELVTLDGSLKEEFWQRADSIENLKMIEPIEGVPPTFRTVIRVAADQQNLYFGVICYDKEPDKITSISKIRDALASEDRIVFVLDTHLDQRTGYIFSINPSGTRYDALVSNFGESENASWDAIWNASTMITNEGWNAEIIIPIRSLPFNSDLREWGFNFERRIQRLIERDRWTGLKRDYKIGHVIHAGRLTDLPEFKIGLGTTVKFSSLQTVSKVYDSDYKTKFDVSGDITQKIKDINAHLTINTDFAETEVDARRTNLTRFPLFFPEKRRFFLEGADIFDFGIGLGSDVVPFFSRRIGLFQGNKVPILFGGKINGEINGTSFGALFTRTNSVNNLVPMSSLGAFRIKQNIFEESSIGLIGTFGDPSGQNNEYVIGADFTYHTSKLFDDKNFLVGIWGLYDKANNGGDNSAIGLKIDYPNDVLDIALTTIRIGNDFSPSLGFVPRTGIKKYSLGADYMPQPGFWSIRRFYFESNFLLITDLQDKWQSWRIFTAPINARFESGDRIEFNIAPAGENLPENFEISDGVILQKGPYGWWRYRIEFEAASKRIINGQAAWWFGSFYTGNLNQLDIVLNFRPTSSINIGMTYEKNIAKLPEGNFSQDLFGCKLQVGLLSNMELSSFIQYDSESKQLGTNTRLRWMFDMKGDLFVVYNHNINKIDNGYWRYDSNQLIIKFSYGVWL
jgi:hypothetical protein